MLVLPIKKKWFDMIKAGEKKEEYREFKNFYHSRLLRYFSSKKDSDVEFICNRKPIIFRNGYNRESPSLLCLCTLNMGTGKEEWGAEKDKIYYILRIKEAKEITKKTKERRKDDKSRTNKQRLPRDTQ